MIILSAHSTSETKIFGLPNFAPYSVKSASVTPLAPELEGTPAAATGRTARRFRNDRLSMRADLTRNRPHQATYFGQMSAPSSLASWFGLLLGSRLNCCSAVAVKQNAVRSQIADQRVQVVSQLLVVQESGHQAFALCGAAKELARVIDRVL